MMRLERQTNKENRDKDNFRWYRGTVELSEDGSITIIGKRTDPRSRLTNNYHETDVAIFFPFKINQEPAQNNSCYEWLTTMIKREVSLVFTRTRQNEKVTFFYNNEKGRAQIKTFTSLVTDLEE